MLELRDIGFYLIYDEATNTLYYEGVLRLSGEEYQPMMDFLNKILDTHPTCLTIDMQKLEFLNSSGITTLARYLLNVTKNHQIPLCIHTSSQHRWQEKSVAIFQKILPKLEIKDF